MHVGTSNRVRQLIAIVALIAGFASTCAWLINRPETLAHALAIANIRSTFRVEATSFRFTPLTSTMALRGLTISQPSTGKQLSVDNISLHYRLWGLLRGKFVIDSINVNGVRITLPPQASDAAERKEHKRINIARLVLLKNLEITDASINDISMSFGKNLQLALDQMHIALIPSLFGEGRLAIHTSGLSLSKEDRPIFSSAELALRTATSFERWTPLFPYFNAFHGKLSLFDATLQGLPIENISAEIQKEDELLNLSKLSIRIGGRELAGSLNTDIDAQRFAVAIDIPEEIKLPFIGKPIETIDTAGAVTASVRLEGTGFVPTESSAQGHLDLVYRFDLNPTSPLAVSTDVGWNNGVLRFENAKAVAGFNAFSFGGSIDIPGKQMNLAAAGKLFPLEHVFDKFQNPHLAKIYGPTDFEGTFKGWGKAFEAKVIGITQLGGWKPVIAERVLAELTATYDMLSLKGTILTGNRETGKANLLIRYGPKIGEELRTKDITLDASITAMPLDNTLREWGLAGIGTGSIQLRGLSTNFTGLVKADVVNGAWHNIPFEHVAAAVDLSRHRITFRDMAVTLPGIAPTSLTGNLIGDITESNFRLHGEPLTGLNIDAAYASTANRWNITQISWKDPELENEGLTASGSITSAGPISLRIHGAFDPKVIAKLANRTLRDARGRIETDIAIGGTTANPTPSGHITLKDTSLRLRSPQIALANMNGSIAMQGNTLRCEQLAAEMDDASLTLSGSITHRGLKFENSNLNLEAKSLRYRTEDRSFRMELNANLALTGSFPNPLLSGDITVLDGRYSKDFNIIEAMTGEAERRRAIATNETPVFNPRLRIKVRNSGELAIRNNVGDIWLNTDIDINGTREKPLVSGAIDTTSGQIHYLGILFDINRGFLEFRGDVDNPYLEIYASKEVNIYNISAVLHGFTDNLQLDLSATSPSGPLDKRDVVSLILFGTTEQDRTARAGSQFTTSMVAQSLTGALTGPISRFAGLDEFRLEAADPSTRNISRVNIGKKVSDRLTVKFSTEINKSSSVQTFSAEYQITDNLLIKGSQSTDATSEFSGLLRFRLR